MSKLFSTSQVRDHDADDSSHAVGVDSPSDGKLEGDKGCISSRNLNMTIECKFMLSYLRIRTAMQSSDPQKKNENQS